MMPKRKKNLTKIIWVRGTILCLWLAVIFVFSGFSGSPYPYSDPPLWYFVERKGAHVGEYAVLLFLAVRFFLVLFPKASFNFLLLLAAIFSLSFGATDELHQFFVPYRGAKVTDVFIDGAGIFLMALFLLIIKSESEKKKTKKKFRQQKNPA